MVARLTTNGALDTSFNGTGYNAFPTASSWGMDGISIDSSGCLLGAGREVGGSSPIEIIRFLSNGIIDTSFGTAGTLTYNVPNGVNYGTATMVLNNGSYILSGYRVSTTFYYLLKVAPNGTVDTSFGTAGITTGSTFGFGDYGGKVLELSSGKLLAAISMCLSGTDCALGAARFSSNGILDTSFGTAGYATINYGPGAQGVYDIAIQPDGKILLCGSGYPGPDAQIVRLNSDGSLDTTFNGTGMRSIDIASNNDGCNNIFVQPDGKILFVGQSVVGGIANVLTGRFLPNGTFDTSYGTGGIFYTNFGFTTLNFTGWGGGLFAMQKSNGKIVIYTSTTDFKSFIGQIQ
jgi:uncharacterized delta-60 repeat protein